MRKNRYQSPELGKYMEELRTGDDPKALESFARRAGTSVNYLWHVAHGRRSPGVKTMYGVVKASRGKISYQSLVENSPSIHCASRVGISEMMNARRRQREAAEPVSAHVR